MATIFEKTSIGEMILKNRIIKSATHEGLGDDYGHPRKELSALYKKIAQNNVGAIITGLVSVQANGRFLKNLRMFDSDEYIEDYKALNLELKQYDTPIILQIAHGGGTCSPKIIGETALAPSAIKLRSFPTKPKELSDSEIQNIINNFVKAILRSKQAGFAGVQLHAAHGYLLAQFLSPHYNKRKDRWGGTTENRFRIVGMIIKEAKKKVGGYPILVKMSALEGTKDGITINESINIAKLLEGAGCDAIEVSCGGDDGFNSVRVVKTPLKAVFELVPFYKKMSPMKKKLLSIMAPLIFKKYSLIQNYNVATAIQIKNQIGIPVITVGGIRKLEDIEDIITNKKIDYVSMARPFIIEPDIITKFIKGVQNESRCINCGYCLLGITAKPIRCYYGKLPKSS